MEDSLTQKLQAYVVGQQEVYCEGKNLPTWERDQCIEVHRVKGGHTLVCVLMSVELCEGV